MSLLKQKAYDHKPYMITWWERAPVQSSSNKHSFPLQSIQKICENSTCWRSRTWKQDDHQFRSVAFDTSAVAFARLSDGWSKGEYHHIACRPSQLCNLEDSESQLPGSRLCVSDLSKVAMHSCHSGCQWSFYVAQSGQYVGYHQAISISWGEVNMNIHIYI